jgi:ribonuclease VapC
MLVPSASTGSWRMRRGRRSPEAVLGRPIPKAERETILGYGPEGVIVDSSAIIAILLKEPGSEHLRDRLAAAEQVSVGAPTVAESSLVLCSRLGRAFIAYGKGRHLAGLNFGDCLTYAVARLTGEPLLCLGDDLPTTDLELA